MSWFLSLLVATVTALLGGTLAGLFARLAVDWYSVSAREGGQGYFVIGFVLLALIAGFIIGLVVSRWIAARPDPGFLKALGLSQLITLGLIGVIGGVARLLADVGPTIGGKNLLLNLEFRWPRGAEPPPAPIDGWWIRLSSASGRVIRVSQAGPIWREDARLEDGHWVVPGAVDLFTSRGDRLITIDPNGVIPSGYLVPVPAWPGKKQLVWSDWLPRPRPGGPPPPNAFRYRFRLVPADQPIRTQTFGRFEVTTLARSFTEISYVGRLRSWSADADFTIRYRGQPVVIEGTGADSSTAGRFEKAQGVALLGGAEPALLVMVNGDRGSGDIWLVAPEGDQVRTQFISRGGGWGSTPPLTNDTTLFQQRARRFSDEGRVDQIAFATPGLFLFDQAILDSRTRTIQRTSFETIHNLVDRIHPLALSPDRKSFVRLAHDTGSFDIEVFEVFNTATNQRYRLPIDRHRMRYGTIDDLDPSYVAHYFAWQKGPDGSDRLVPRPGVAPLHYRGELSSNDPDYREYRVYLAKESLRPALIDFLVAEFKAEPQPPQDGAYSQEVKVDGSMVHISWSKEDEHVGVWMDRGSNTELVAEIARRFNAALASGRYDGEFEQ